MRPKPNQLFFLFSIVSIAEISLLANELEQYRSITKPLIIPLLASVYLTMTKGKGKWHQDAIVWGLFFSWLGDILLQKDSLFVPGLLSFLTAHVFYISFFSRTISKETSFFKLRPVMLIAVSRLPGGTDAPDVAFSGSHEVAGVDLRSHNQCYAFCCFLAVSKIG